MRMLDCFCGRFGWGKKFAERGWEVLGIDLIEPDVIPPGCTFIKADILSITPQWVIEQGFDFICASSPCEQFSVHGMKHFHPNPPYPEVGMKLFNHTRALLERSGIPYIMENVRSAQKFVGNAVNHAGPFYLWGNAVPPLMPHGVSKGISLGSGSAMKGMTQEEKKQYRKQFPNMQVSGTSAARARYTAQWATIPDELSNLVAHYAEGLI